MEQKDIPLETIFVAIASLEDTELKRTVEDLFAKAKHPDRVTVGIALQDTGKAIYKDFQKKFKNDKRVKLSLIELNRKNVLTELGVGLGRARAHGHYADEDYVLQIDSHSMFEQDWDVTLIEMLREAKFTVKSDRVVLTAYAGSYFLDDKGNRTTEFEEGSEEHQGFYYPLFSRFERSYGVVPAWKTVPLSKVSNTEAKFIPAPKFNANFAFGDRSFARSMGLENTFVFFEEEIIQSVNLLGGRWSLVFPNVPTATVRHLYSNGRNIRKLGRKTSNDYLSNQQSDAMIERLEGNYKAFLADESRTMAKESYERYANISLELGRQSADTKYPSSWVLDIFNQEQLQAEFLANLEAKESKEADAPVQQEAPAEGGCGCQNKHDHGQPEAEEEKKPKEARPWDLLNPNIGRVSEEVKEMRMALCKDCPFFVKLTQQCTKCGCHMPWKTGLPHASCPVGKWDAVPDEGN